MYDHVFFYFMQCVSPLGVEAGSELGGHISDVQSASSSPSVKSDISREDFMINHASCDSHSSLDVISHVSGDSHSSSDVWDCTNENIHTFEAIPPISLVTPTLFSNCHSTVHEYKYTLSHVTSELKPINSSESISSVGPFQLSGGMDDHTHIKDSTMTKEETLFDDLMMNSSEGGTERSHTGLGAGNSAVRFTFANQTLDMATNSTCTHMPVNSDSQTASDYMSRESSSDEGSTPRASPYTSPSGIRRWSVKKRQSYDYNDPDVVTPPNMHTWRQQSSSEFDRAIFPPSCFDPQRTIRHPVIQKNLDSCQELERSEFDQDSVEMARPNYQLRPNCQGVATEADTMLGGVEISNSIPLLSTEGRDAEMGGGLRFTTLEPGIPFHSSITIPQSSSTLNYRSHSFSKKSRSSSFSNLVRRTHSFGSTLRHIIHRRERSVSSDDSPLPSPRLKSKKQPCSPNSTTDVKNRQRTISQGYVSPESPPTSAVTCLMDELKVERRSLHIPHIHIDPSVTVDFGDLPISLGLAPIPSPILPPPAEFNGSSDGLERTSNRESSTEKSEEDLGGVERDRSIFSFFRKHKLGSRSATPTDQMRDDKRPDFNDPVDLADTTTESYEDSDELHSSNDMFSFDEVLKSYDQYASETGRTAQSSRQAKEVNRASFSPSVQERGKKKNKKMKKRHGYTVDNIDSETLKQVRLNLTRNEEMRNSSDSRVHKLAREYSQKIKERNRLIKRHSTVLEVSSEEVECIPRTPEPPRPEWLSQLRTRSRRISMDNLHVVRELKDSRAERDISFSEDFSHLEGENGNQSRHLGSLTCLDQHEWEEEIKIGKLKGWVRSLVAKFGKKET